ncbi:hypothetical protein [Phyllobacterium sp. 628]|uniref:hypothetical protein n=1 Tax=Phyllobacterium sp. 628 TaxID=2718938 RepID=UPI001FCF18A9|nr:hypothetical protein [Phyllobacterium sp. 628]
MKSPANDIHCIHLQSCALNLGKSNINALTEPNAEARACNQFYEHVRDMLLQGYPWRFAGKTQSLAQLTNDKLGKWAYAYSRPVDCLKVRWVRPAYSTTDMRKEEGALIPEYSYPHDIEGTTIYSDLSPAFLRYTVRLTDPTKFTPLFVDALAWHLAVRLAMPLTRDPKMRADAFQLAQQTQGLAQEADANEVRETSDHETEFVAGR